MRRVATGLVKMHHLMQEVLAHVLLPDCISGPFHITMANPVIDDGHLLIQRLQFQKWLAKVNGDVLPSQPVFVCISVATDAQCLIAVLFYAPLSGVIAVYVDVVFLILLEVGNSAEITCLIS